MADGTWLCTGRFISFRKFNNLGVIVLVLVLLMMHQPSDLARCQRKKLHTLSQDSQPQLEQVFTISRPPCSRRFLSSAFNRFVPKHSKTPIRGGYNASDHEVPSGPNPISN